MDPNLYKLFADRYQRTTDNSKSFSDMLRERRGFVQGEENAVGDMTRNSIVNGSNGVPINPVSALGDFVGYHTDNANKTAQLTQEGLGYEKESGAALEALMTLIMNSQQTEATQRNAERDFSLKREEQDRKNFESGYTNGKGDKSGLNGKQAVAEVLKNGGEDLLPADAAERQQVALGIINAGGVDKYRKTLKPSKEKQEIITNIDTLLSSDTNPLTGSMRLSNNDVLGGLMDSLTGSNTQYTKATLKQLKSQLALLSAGKIKGQGAISEFERKALQEAASKLNSDKLQNKDLVKILKEVKKTLGGDVSEPKTKVGEYIIEEVK